MKVEVPGRKEVLNTILYLSSLSNVHECLRFGKLIMTPREILRAVEDYSKKTGIHKKDMDFTVGYGRQLFINGTYICTM